MTPSPCPPAPPPIRKPCSYSASRNCLGARFGTARDGTPVCNISIAEPPAWILSGAEAFAHCVWVGHASRLDPGTADGRTAPPKTCGAVTALEEWQDAAGDAALLKKPWLPKGLTHSLVRRINQVERAQGIFDEALVQELSVLSFASFALGVFVTLLCVCICQCSCTRQLLAAMGSACGRLTRGGAPRAGDDGREEAGWQPHGRRGREEEGGVRPGARLLGNREPASDSIAHRVEAHPVAPL